MDRVGKIGYQNCRWSRQIWKRMMIEWVNGGILFFFFLEDAEGV